MYWSIQTFKFGAFSQEDYRFFYLIVLWLFHMGSLKIFMNTWGWNKSMKSALTTTIVVKKTFSLIEVLDTVEVTSIFLLQKEHMDCNICHLFQMLSLTRRELCFKMSSTLEFFYYSSFSLFLSLSKPFLFRIWRCPPITCYIAGLAVIIVVCNSEASKFEPEFQILKCY